MHDFQKLFQQFAGIEVAIIGDVMLDTYWFGSVDRISPEGPVPVVSLRRKELRIGGAGNVALNIVSLGAQATLFSITGDDAEGKALSELLVQNNINTSYLVKTPDRVTTNKIRIVGRNQQMMRLDAEVITDISASQEDELIDGFKTYALTEKPAVAIFEDYNKGVLTERIIAEIIAICKEHNIITAVDPKRKNFFSYKGVDLFKPNIAEVKEGLNLLLDEISVATLRNIHDELFAKLAHGVSMITLSEKGIFYQQKNESHIVPTHARSIADVSGAGDTVIAVASVVYAATKDIELAAEVANVAGGLVCEQVGTVAIDKQKLLLECMELL